MSNKQVLCIMCKIDFTPIYHIPCKICDYEIIDGTKIKVYKECIHTLQYISCKACLWGDGGKIYYVEKK